MSTIWEQEEIPVKKILYFGARCALSAKCRLSSSCTPFGESLYNSYDNLYVKQKNQMQILPCLAKNLRVRLYNFSAVQMKDEGTDFCIRIHCNSCLAVEAWPHTKICCLKTAFAFEWHSAANTVNREGLSKLKFFSEWLAGKSSTRWEMLFEVLLALHLAIGIFVISFKALQHGLDKYEIRECEYKPVRAEYLSPFQSQQNNEKWPR